MAEISEETRSDVSLIDRVIARELWTDEGCRVLLIVAPEDYLPSA